MASFSEAKTLGEVGSILVVLSIIPVIGWLIGLIGFILVLIAVKYISDSLGDVSIFNNMIISVITAIAGLIIGGIFIFGSLFAFARIRLGVIPRIILGEQVVVPTRLLAFLLTIVIGLIALWICFIVSSLFLRKSYRTIGTKLGLGMFSTTAMIYLIGAVTTIAIIGFILLLIAEILQIVAFFSMPAQPLPPPPPTTTT